MAEVKQAGAGLEEVVKKSGLTPEQLLDLIERYQQGRLGASDYRRKRKAALDELIANHKQEWEALKRMHGTGTKS